MHPLVFPWTVPSAVLGVLAYVLAVVAAAVVGRMVYNRGEGKSLGSPIVAGAFAFLLGAWFVSTKTPFEAQPIPLHTYGLMIALGFLFGIHLAARAAEKYASVDGLAFYLPGAPTLRQAAREKGDAGTYTGKMAREHLLDLSFWILAGAMVGARLLFIVVNWEGPNGYGANPSRIFDLTSGGLVFYGGFIGAALTSVWYARKHGINFRALADICIPVVALGHFFGRMGCMAAGCCWGKVCENANFLFGAEFPKGALAHGEMARSPEWASFIAEHGHTPALHPTQMYEGLGELALFAILLLFRKNKRFHGQILAMWLMLYAVLRLSIETFRGDWGRGMLLRWPEVDPVLLSTSQLVGVGMVVLGAVLFFLWKPRSAAPAVPAAPAAAA
ncbi:prolipoprotein diacylglyceryl transferase [Vulgatibacter sp.]|uniref:prolipoprotein diacylglyceryl transferase n=1 Tax=Vulgatibacter sp. TaxID=1971226 RepID=UPI00356811E2